MWIPSFFIAWMWLLSDPGMAVAALYIGSIETKEGQEAEMSCPVSPENKNGLWFRQGPDTSQLQPISPERGVISLESRYGNTEAVIIFHTPRFDDTGTFVYRDLHLSENICQFKLDVLSRPQATCVPDLAVIEGEILDVTLNCSAQGNPQPDFHWYRVGTGGTEIIDMNVSGNILKIYNVTRFAGGEYRCKVENSEGDDMCSTVLSVEFLPEVEVFESMVEKEVGEETTLMCKVTANPIIETNNIIWTKGTDLEKLRTDYRYILKLDNSMLESHYTAFLILVIRTEAFHGDVFDDYWCSIKGYGPEYRKKVVVKRKEESIDKRLSIAQSR